MAIHCPAHSELPRSSSGALSLPCTSTPPTLAAPFASVAFVKVSGIAAGAHLSSTHRAMDTHAAVALVLPPAEASQLALGQGRSTAAC